MKRCPQCDFIYNDTDDVCDLDGANLIEVDEAQLPLREAPRPKSNRNNRSRVFLVCAVGAFVFALLTAAYLFLTRTRQQTRAQTPTVGIRRTPPAPADVSLTTPEPSTSPEASPTIGPKPQPTVEQPKRVALSKDPIATSADNKESGTIWIKLTNGARIEADEVWRTKEGVWYRRNGLVTLIKANRVKAIEKAKVTRR